MAKVRKMRDSGGRATALTALSLLPAAFTAGGCGDAGGGTATTPATTAAVSTTTLPAQPAPIRERDEVSPDSGSGRGDRAGRENKTAPAGSDAGREAARERRFVRWAQRAYRAYVRAINARDGAALCRLLAPGFMDELTLPVRRGSCPERLSGSIGYRDPRGAPVWERTEPGTLESAIVDEQGRVQLSVAIATRFADRDEASVESDIAYLAPTGGRGSPYVLAKAPGSLWRAVGKPDIPPQVIAPPPGFG